MDNPAQNSNSVIPPIADENGGFPASGGFGGPPPTAPVVGTVAPAGGSKSRVSGKVIATIFGLLLLVGGIGAGIILVNQQQTLKEKAAGGIQCDAGTCNDGFSYGQDCAAPQATCDQRNQEACSAHSGWKSGGLAITCGGTTTGGTGTLQAGAICYTGSCASGLACSWYKYDSGCDTYTKTTNSVFCFGDASCKATPGECPTTDTKSDPRTTGPQCVATATGVSGPTAGSNSCSGNCCSANTAGGYTIRVCSCAGPLVDGRCTSSNGTCTNGGGSACIPTNFCGSMQLDVVSGGFPGSETGIAIARNGQTTCSGGQVPTSAPSGGTTTPTLKACGETCTSDGECRNPSANGSSVKCINGSCQNTSCVGKTIPGANCDCSNLNACGQPCSATVGLCQAGSSCAYVVGSSCTASSVSSPTAYCIPAPLPAGWTGPKCVARDQLNNYVLNEAGQNPTLAEIQQACAPTITAQCSSVGAYDTNWNPLTTTQLSALKPGDKVRFTVTGTTSSGSFDQARFTINGAQQAPVTGKRPNSADFFEEYTIPAGVASFTVTAQIHLPSNDTWY